MIDALTATTAHSAGSATPAALIAAISAVICVLITALTTWRSTTYEQLLDDIQDIIRAELDGNGQDHRRMRRRRHR